MRTNSKILARLFSKESANPDRIPSRIPDRLPPDTVLDEQWFRELFPNSADILIHSFQLSDADPFHKVILVACDGMTDNKQINQYVIPRIMAASADDGKFHPDRTGLELTRFESIGDMITRVFSGQLILYFTNIRAMYAFDVAEPPDRMPEESNTELSIKGPRDGFVENLKTNVALVRKRLRTNSLHYEKYSIGQRSESLVGLLYIEDFIRPELLAEARKRINNIDIDTLFSSAQLEEIISDSTYSLFPLLTYTGRPDFVVNCLIHGRFAIIVDSAPIAVIAPVNLTLLLKTPEDIYFPSHIVSFQMGIRLVGLMISLLLPGFWIALISFNLEQVPFPLLATVVTTRIGLPMPGPLEAFMMLGLFEVFREAGVRLPKAVGQTVAVVGGIIVGDAVIQAGLASTTMLIVAALTAVATFTLVNQTLSSAVAIIRAAVMLAAAVIGMYGFILAVILIALYLSKLESFGVPYLAPLSPLKPRSILASIFKKPMKYDKNNPQFILDETRNKQGDPP